MLVDRSGAGGLGGWRWDEGWDLCEDRTRAEPPGWRVEEAKRTEGHHDAALRGGGLGRIDSHGASS